MDELLYHFAQGVLRIHAIGARELEKKDIGLLSKGKSDPFCEIEGVTNKFTSIENFNEQHCEDVSIRPTCKVFVINFLIFWCVYYFSGSSNIQDRRV